MTAFGRWLPAITQTSFVRKGALGVAGLAFFAGPVAGPALTSAQAAPAMSAKPVALVQKADDSGKDHRARKDADFGKREKASNKADSGKDEKAPKKGRPSNEVNYQYQRQSNFYYCGPASTRIALSAGGHILSQDEVAKKLGTTVNGTNSAEDTTRVLNSVNGNDFYKTRSIPGNTATPAEMDRLQADVVHAIDNGHAVVANIIGTATDTDGNVHSFLGGHYLAVVGYGDEGRTVKIADPWETRGDGSYWMTTIDMANWMATRGYSA